MQTKLIKSLYYGKMEQRVSLLSTGSLYSMRAPLLVLPSILLGQLQACLVVVKVHAGLLQLHPNLQKAVRGDQQA